MVSSVTFSQTEKGKWTIVASSNSLFKTSNVANADNDTRFTSFSISPNEDYFFMDNLAAGLGLDVETSKMKNANEGNFDFSIAPFVRYYFLKPTTKKLNAFGDPRYGFGTYKVGYIDSQ